MKQSSLPIASFFIATALTTAAIVGYATINRHAEAKRPSHPLHVRIPSGGATCKLSVGDQVKAVKAFRDMLPVFRHPRCANCHGEFDIFSSQHGDGEGADVARNNGVDPTAFLTAAQRVAKFDSCNDCHSGVAGHGIRAGAVDTTTVAGWMLPPPPMMWKGLDDEQLCLKVKSFERDAREFLFHVEKDHDEQKFVDVAFRGDRALPADLLQAYKVTVQGPPMSSPEFLAKASRWVDLLADQWNDPASCGCVMPKIRLNVEHKWVMDTPGGLPSRQSSAAQFDVDLEPMGDDRPGAFMGQISLDRHVDFTVPAQCTARATPKERWQFTALLDPQDGSLKIWHVQIPVGDPKGEIVCQHGGGTARMGVDAEAVGVAGAGEFVIPAGDSIFAKQETIEGVRENLKVIVRVRPDSP